TGISGLYPNPEEGAAKWLLTSPFIRTTEGIRKKVIAFICPEDPGDSIYEEIQNLKRLGYQPVLISKKEQPVQPAETYKTLNDMPFDVDAVWFKNDAVIHPAIVEQIINKQASILWVENADTINQTLEHLRATGITVIPNLHLYTAYTQLRKNNAINTPVKA